MAIDLITANPELSPRQQAWLRALVKAQSLGIVPVEIFGGLYEVAGSQGNTYSVRRLDVAAKHFSCDCPAGQSGKPCYHAAAVAALPAETNRRRCPGYLKVHADGANHWCPRCDQENIERIA